MPAQSLLLLSNTSAPSVDSSTFSHGDAVRSNGYYNLGSGLHTVVFLLDTFKGYVKLQGTLAVEPTDSDWFDIQDAQLDCTDSTILVSEYRNFYGNFVWIRAAYNLTNGSIREIRYNY